MRGTHTYLGYDLTIDGIIPAYAGNTSSLRLRWTGGRDHPRVCGEHPLGSPPLGSGSGSSPRMRGTRQGSTAKRAADGIIPAYAGNTFSLLLVLGRRRDHPRVCGEHPLVRRCVPRDPGSSPRMRGTQLFCLCRKLSTGIIPAYAGNTFYNTSKLLLIRDHPRVCGEHESPASQPLRNSGSSPRMRGTLSDTLGPSVRTGIIPAYAGNTRHRGA